jgi:hypothetical protein
VINLWRLELYLSPKSIYFLRKVIVLGIKRAYFGAGLPSLKLENGKF